MRLKILFIILLLIMLGCISSPDKNYYQLHLEGGKIAGKIKIDKTILVRDIDIDPAYNDYRIIYRNSPYQVNFYSYEFWVKKPNDLVKDSIIDYFKSNGIFRKISGKVEGREPDLIMRSKIRIIEEYDIGNKWYARLSMDLSIENYKKNKMSIVHSFDRKIKLERKRTSDIPVILSLILREELDKVLIKISAVKN
ncbi:MAG: hypothetical protein ABFR75_03015 [Acidobacteriota bacterium]